MIAMTGSRRVRLSMLVVVGVLLLVAASCYWARSGPRPQAATEFGKRGGWKTIEYQRIRVDVPADWEGAEMDGCEFPVERWVPPGSPACEPDAAGVAFYGSATFDPAFGPGVRRAEANGTNASAWAGYVYAGDFAVHASNADRDLVEEVLGSARPVRK
jgi:hypothetical protein